MPTEIATLSLLGHGVEDRLAEPGEHKNEDDEALEDDEAHGIGPRHLRRDGECDEGVEPESGGEREREVRDDTHEDREQAGDERGARGDRWEVGAVAGATSEEVAVDVLGEPEDERVEHDDVGHREERDDPASHLPADRRAALGDLEVAVDRGGPGARVG